MGMLLSRKRHDVEPESNVVDEKVVDVVEETTEATSPTEPKVEAAKVADQTPATPLKFKK